VTLNAKASMPLREGKEVEEGRKLRLGRNEWDQFQMLGRVSYFVEAVAELPHSKKRTGNLGCPLDKIY